MYLMKKLLLFKKKIKKRFETIDGDCGERLYSRHNVPSRKTINDDETGPESEIQELYENKEVLENDEVIENSEE